MIEVNLLPGAKRSSARRSKKRASLSAPSITLPEFDRLLGGAIAAWVLAVVLVGWWFVSTRAAKADLELNIEAAVRDSARYAAIIEANAKLQARRDTIAQKLEIIQEVDAGRYTWPHILDEVSRALPDYTWITSIEQTEGGPLPAFRIVGRTGNNFALTQFMKNLEESPFLTNVRLASTELIREGERLVHTFTLGARYREPPPDAIETVTLTMPEE